MKMKTLLLTIVLAVFFGTVIPPKAEARVTFSYFYDSLQPYGEWVDVDHYGYCWQPVGMDRDWRPYTDGYWSYTDAGWTWVSYEDFGSITYHYGRWIRLEDYGWVWKPDYEWGPAWVSWRQSDDYIGWAPLPPDAVFEPETGIGVWVDRDYDIGPSAYNFCEYRYFGAPVVRNFLVPRQRNFAIINSTVNITNITVVTGPDHRRVVYNGGLDYRRIADRSEHRIATLQLVRRTEGDWAQHHRSELSRQVGTQLIINAPEIEAPRTRLAPARVSQQISAPKIDRGWTGVADTAERERIKARYHDQTQGLTRTTAPAITVEPAQVQTMMNQARTHQPRGAQSQVQPQQVQPQQVQPQQIQRAPQQQSPVTQQMAPTPQMTPAQKEHSRHSEPGQTIQPLPQPKIQQDQQAEQQRKAADIQARAAQQQSPVTPQMAPTPQMTPAQKDHSRHAEPGQTIQPLPQPKIQQDQQAEQQRKAADIQARAAQQQERAQQQANQQRKASDIQARAAQQQERAQQQAEQQRKASDIQARAAQQQERAQQQAEQQRRAADAQARAAQQQEGARRQQEQAARQMRQPQAQPAPAQPQGQAQQSPSPDGKKKHRDHED